MEAMVRTVFSGSPGTVVILSTLLPSRDHDANMLIINEQYRALISKLQSQGFKIQLAEMHDGFLTMNDLISDGIHPTYDGAKKMASSWYKAIVAVEKKG
jgi:lysophospholipase L1-like esterase